MSHVELGLRFERRHSIGRRSLLNFNGSWRARNWNEEPDRDGPVVNLGFGVRCQATPVLGLNASVFGERSKSAGQSCDQLILGFGRHARIPLFESFAEGSVEPAALYHERREIETAYDEVRNRILGPGAALRSKTPNLVCQEIEGLMLVPPRRTLPGPHGRRQGRRGSRSPSGPHPTLPQERGPTRYGNS